MEELKRLKNIKVENYVWVIYIGIIILSWYANNVEKDYLINKDKESKCLYQALMILIFSILLLIYSYFTFDSYSDYKSVKEFISNKFFDTSAVIKYINTLIPINIFVIKLSLYLVFLLFLVRLSII